jgi:uncharacterized protein
MKKVLIVPGWYQKPENNWYPWLKKELEMKDYSVCVPDLPTNMSDLPDPEKMLDLIYKLIDIDKNTIVIGHSLSCILAMRMAEEYRYQKMILVAGWDFNDLTYEHRLFWKRPINHKKIKENISEIFCIASDNDKYFTQFTNIEMSKRLGATSIIITGMGHFTDEYGIKTIPQLLKLI